jgi:AraC family transcriptional regulator of adaptative response/methylated-DNA-[protein]-cysteine methyltransferase
VCAILLGDNPEALVHEVHHLFPQANLIEKDNEGEHLLASIVDFVEAPTAGLQVSLDIQGTAFQRRVWQVLQQIPAGKTASYAEIARQIGSPQSARVVAQACGANRLAVAIPCHRVVRTDGTLSGYR